MILDKRRITIRKVAYDVGTSFGLCQAIFTNVVGIKRAAANIIPKLLNFKQKQRHMDFTQEVLTMFNDNPYLLKKVIPGDVSWVYGFDIETKAQSSQWSQWKHPEVPRFRRKRRQVRWNV